MKRIIYLILFPILGILLSTLVVGTVELLAIFAFRKDPQMYGFNWDSWYTIHITFISALASMGALWGYLTGIKCWKILYEGPNPLYKVPFYKRAAAFKQKNQ